MAFKMKNPFKQTIMPLLTPRVSLGDLTHKHGEAFTKEEIAENLLNQKIRKCNESANTEWKNGKCVNKKITMVDKSKSKKKSDSKAKPSTSGGSFA